MAKYTTEQIIKQFRNKHGEDFDYSLVDYHGTAIKVTIICRKHGPFEQLAGAHKRGQGCAKCMYDGKRKLANEVIEQFKSVHGSRYDYSFVKYKNVDTKVKIVCAEHGVFLQTPYLHRAGSGCPKCVGKNKSQEDMIELFIKAHGNRYDYSKVEFVRVNEKVEIVCSEHGSFYQIPINHASGKGCIKCSGTYQYNTDEIIGRFIGVHGAIYDYSLVDYINSDTKIKIVCLNHGVFEQMPYSHMSGSGCPSCSSSYQPSTSEVIKQFKSIHFDRYDYSRVDYQGAFVDVEIVCKTHGSFMQTAKTHKKGSGCPDCAITIGHTKNSYLEYCNGTDGNTHLYLIECKGNNERFYKVGIAKKGANTRFDSRRKLPYDFSIIKEVYGPAGLIWDLEKSIHGIMSDLMYKPDIGFNGKTECFSKVPEQVIKLLNDFNESDQLMFLV